MRLAVLAAGGALALAGSASAAYAPKFSVQQGPGKTTVSVSAASTDDPSASLVFFAPADAGTALTAAAGTTIGRVTGLAGVHGGLIAPLTGRVQARAAAAGTDCTGSTAHAAYWALSFTGSDLPVFVDRIPATVPYGPLVSYSVTVCLPATARIFELALTLDNVFSAPTVGDNLWRLLATPYGEDQTATAVEAQSFVETASISLPTPTRTLTAAAATFGAAGTVQIAGLSDTTPSIALARGAAATRLAAFAHPTARANGRYEQRFAVRRLPRRAQTLFLQATATASPRDLVETACKPTFGDDIPCIGATAGGFAATSPLRKVVVPMRP